ncbi:hypothetical protein [Paenibacillus sp. GCM10027626]|uniref:hypothetical protein n=1 Tax=Paenibacillus sp. GCM10027626 TaxID=3273411 RepID=UPI0036298ED5
MDFEASHQQFLQRHLEHRSGERKGRLKRGHNHAEKLLLQHVWWPVFGNLDDLHPEYEILDWNRKSQYLDFAYLPPYGRFGIECDGFQSHIKDMDRERFSYALNRENFLTAMGWTMIHFSYDDVLYRPEICQMLLQMIISPYLVRNTASPVLSPHEKDLLRFVWSKGKPLRTRDVINHYRVNFRTAQKWLQQLVGKGLLRPITKNQYICHYELAENFAERWL